MNPLNNKPIIPSESQLSTQKASLIKTGLEIAQTIDIPKEHLFSEDEYSEFRHNYNRMTASIQDMSEEFMKQGTNNPHDIPTSFNVNDNFSVFDKIEINPMYILDYVYVFDHHGGEPFVYARKKTDAPFQNSDEYFSCFSLPKPDMLLGQEASIKARSIYLDHLSFEKSFMGYFQFGLFCLTVDQFYKYWHSCYNERRYIVTKKGLENYVANQMTQIDYQKAKKMLAAEVKPKVVLKGKIGELSLLFFDPHGGGLYRMYISIGWPNNYIGHDVETIVRGLSYLF